MWTVMLNIFDMNHVLHFVPPFKKIESPSKIRDIAINKLQTQHAFNTPQYSAPITECQG